MAQVSVIRKLVTDTPSSYQTYPIMLEAHYGVLDVSSFIRQHRTHDLVVSNENFTDPCLGVLKDLTITLSDGSKRIFTEHSRIDTYQFQYSYQHVISAKYGWGTQIIDVTLRVRQQREPFSVSNDIFTDPCAGRVKSLLIDFEYGVNAYIEGAVVDPTTWSSTTPFIIHTL